MVRLALLSLYSLAKTPRTPTSIPCAVVGLFESLAFIYGSYMEHGRSIHPSAILICSLLLTLCFDAARLRTLWAIQDNGRIKTTFAIAVALKSLALITEIWPKVSQLREGTSNLAPEATSSVLAKVFFTWLIPLFRTGYKNTLYVEDMWPIDSDLQSDRNFARVTDMWRQSKCDPEII